MSVPPIAATLALALAAAPQAAATAPTPAPAPAAQPPSPAEIVAAAPATEWIDIPPAELLVMELDGDRRVVIRLAPAWAPVHVDNVRALAAAGHWDGQAIARVQDNYVVQWGAGSADRPLPPGIVAAPPAEYERPAGGIVYRALPFPDAYAPATGHSADGWPIARDATAAWLPHCYAMVGVGRELPPDTGSGAELYAVIGHAPRHLDRNLALIGQVIAGIEHLAALPRGTGPLGFYADARQQTPIRRLRGGAEVAALPRYQFLDPTGASFAAYAAARAHRRDPFFHRPSGGADICNMPVPVRSRP
jgi:peptidylprolyl isomerase